MKPGKYLIAFACYNHSGLTLDSRVAEIPFEKPIEKIIESFEYSLSQEKGRSVRIFSVQWTEEIEEAGDFTEEKCREMSERLNVNFPPYTPR